jgi:hypothetical protein
MRSLPSNATDDELRQLVVEWSENLAAGQFAEALSMFPYSKHSFDVDWTPDALASWIANFGCDESFDGEAHRITSIASMRNPEEFVRTSIEVDRENLYGLDPSTYVGMIHFYNVPLDGARSDLTARFHIMKTGENRLTLEFLDIHIL